MSSGLGAGKNRLTFGLLIALLISLGLAAIIGLIGTATGDLGVDGGRLLGSLAICAAFMALALASVVTMDRGILMLLGFAGLVASATGLVLSVYAVWTEPDDSFFRPWGTVVLTSVVLAYASLLMLITRSHRVVRALVIASLVSLGAGWVVSLVGIWGGISDGDVIGRLLAALGILAVFGGLASPILNRFLRG